MESHGASSQAAAEPFAYDIEGDDIEGGDDKENEYDPYEWGPQV